VQHPHHLRQSGKAQKIALLISLLVVAALGLLLASNGMIPVGFRDQVAIETTLSDARGMENPVPASPQVLAEGKALYGELCAHCHGDEGRGDGPEAMMYDPSPADFTREKTARSSDGELFYKITEGRKPMPSFQRTLTDQQRWTMVHYIRTFAKKQE
jgi:mono/diheme cytochrome c family protein